MASQLSRKRPAGTVRVAVAQTAPELAANQKNLDQVVEWLGHDIRFPEPARLPALQGADIIAFPSNWPVVERVAFSAGPRPPPARCSAP